MASTDDPSSFLSAKPFVPPVTSGYVVDVHDGDTITVCSTLPFSHSPTYRFRIRLSGIDTPELKSKDAEERDVARLARDYLSGQVLNKWVALRNVKVEKYGRLLADVYLGDIHLNQNLLDKRYAVKYGGKKKVSPVSWKAFLESGSWT